MEDFDSYLPRKIQALLSNHGMYKKEFKHGKQVVTGTKRLRASGAYTTCFGRKVANLFKKYRGRVDGLPSINPMAIFRLEQGPFLGDLMA